MSKCRVHASLPRISIRYRAASPGSSFTDSTAPPPALRCVPIPPPHPLSDGVALLASCRQSGLLPRPRKTHDSAVRSAADDSPRNCCVPRGTIATDAAVTATLEDGGETSGFPAIVVTARGTSTLLFAVAGSCRGRRDCLPAAIFSTGTHPCSIRLGTHSAVAAAGPASGPETNATKMAAAPSETLSWRCKRSQQREGRAPELLRTDRSVSSRRMGFGAATPLLGFRL